MTSKSKTWQITTKFVRTQIPLIFQKIVGVTVKKFLVKNLNYEKPLNERELKFRDVLIKMIAKMAIVASTKN